MTVVDAFGFIAKAGVRIIGTAVVITLIAVVVYAGLRGIERWRPRSWFGYLNFFVLQFAGVRLQRTVDKHGQHIAWNLIGPIVPMTGWWQDYVWMLPKGWRLDR